MIKSLIYSLLLSAVVFSCAQYSRMENVVEFDGNCFTVLSSGLISVRSSEIERENFNYDTSITAFKIKTQEFSVDKKITIEFN